MTTENQAPEGTSNLDDFSSVFESLIEKGETNETDTATGQTDGAGVPAGDDANKSDQAAGTGDSAQSTAPGGDAAPQDGAGPQDDQGGQPDGGGQGAQDVNWQEKFQSLADQFEAFKAGTQQGKPPAGDAPPAAAPEVYTADEKAELETLQQDWPDIHRLFSLMARQLQVDTLNYTFSEVGKVLTPLQESVTAYSTNDHLNAIYDAHADYDAVYQPVMEWIEQQPSFLKAAYQNVVKQGTAEDVSTMIQRFKDETKWVAPDNGNQAPAAKAAPSQQGNPAPAQQQTGLSEAAKKAAKAMGAVGTKRGVAATGQDPADFDGAWAEAVGA